MDTIKTQQIKAAIHRMSESVFVGLCHKLGTSQLVAMRRDVVDIGEMVENQKKFKEECIILSGSRKEGFRLKKSDLDVMQWPNNHRVIWEISQSRIYSTRRTSLLLCDCSDSPPGFTLLSVLTQHIGRFTHRACVRMKNRYYISSSKYRQAMAIRSASTLNCTEHGPCVSGIHNGALEYDHAHCFYSVFWPPSASSWIDRSCSWPRPHIVADIVENGCHFVAIGHKLGYHENHEWRISFSLAEQKLIYSMNHCQFLTYGLLKLFLTEIINKGLGDEKLLCSYHMKTAVFWVIQENAIPHWCPQSLLECFWICFKLILKWVYEGVCPNFFIPDNNMFLSKIYGEAQHQLFIRLYGLYERGLESLLHSPSLRSHIMEVLHNPRLSICTHEYTLISEAEFDLQLFNEILDQDSFPKSSLRDCYKVLYDIEHLIDSPFITQYQVVMLQKLRVSTLVSLGFILHTKTYAYKHKLRYRADKVTCHMLKLAAKCGAISDMMFIAMYYYKTLRYMKALSIIEVIKVKLTQPYVMHDFTVDAEMYTETVGGQSWSTKMRQAVALGIKLNNKICYINELMPEQQATLQTSWPFLLVHTFVLLYMLEILCYRYIDTMRALAALDDLHTLVHNDHDQGLYVHYRLRDISWQILGICQQVTGYPQDALYSYQQSLRQPFCKFVTATEMRIQGIHN